MSKGGDTSVSEIFSGFCSRIGLLSPLKTYKNFLSPLNRKKNFLYFFGKLVFFC